jgi:hypothetical protein
LGLALEVSREGMVNCEFLFQLIRAKTMQRTLAVAAIDSERYPTGRKTKTAAGLKIKAIASRATVPVYCVPVGF